MIGIYKITNLINGKVYIGKSTNIEKRWKEHLRGPRKNISKMNILYKAFNKYGMINFQFEVLKECSTEELNELEVQYIKEYHSCIFDEQCAGYNATFGANNNLHFLGEMNSNAKMTEKDVYSIREEYLKGAEKKDVYVIYQEIISLNTFSDIWCGKTWKQIHYDVYTDENKQKQRNNWDRQSKREHLNILSNEDILKIRDAQNEGASRDQIYEMFSEKINIHTFHDIWYGHTFKHIQSTKPNNRTKSRKLRKQTGTLNNSAKFTEQDIIFIRTNKKNGNMLHDVYCFYKEKVSYTCFKNVWDYKTYKDISVD